LLAPEAAPAASKQTTNKQRFKFDCLFTHDRMKRPAEVLPSPRLASPQRHLETIVMANSFSHISAACVRVLARQAAINAVKSELQRRGERVHSVPMRDIQIAADDYLAAHPELVEQAQERVAAQPEKWLPKRALQTC
jgi:hypothetical protein